MPLLTHDDSLDIAIGRSRLEANWRNKTITWSSLLERLSVTQRTHESYAEYLASKKPRQDEIKDVGGFIGGRLNGGRRGKDNVSYRQLVTLDIDFAPAGIWDDFTLLYGCAAAIYSTHKHGPDKPRMRLVIPLDRHVLCDEYQAIARKLAGSIGIEFFDDTTYQPERIMYWPSTSKDGDFVFEYQDAPFLSADEILGQYRDWKDVSEWPVSDRQGAVLLRAIKKQGDPLEKKGIVGAFCRTFTIHEAIEAYLSDVYATCDMDDRYTYVNGSTSAGLITYEDKYAYSHHGTDPISMKLCNAFDLVRIHKYGLRDEDCKDSVAIAKRPSHMAMEELAAKDARVRVLLVNEHLEAAREDLDTGDIDPETEDATGNAEPADDSWKANLSQDRKGNTYSTLPNLVTILRHDPVYKGRIALNTFEQKEVVVGKAAWRTHKDAKDELTDTDLALIQHRIEVAYGTSFAAHLEKAIQITREANQFHPVRDYLNSLTWDKMSRVDTLLTDYMGAIDNPYTRAVIRKTLAAGVARVFTPGCKFDYVLTLVGEQGLKKSMLMDKLGGQWFSDSFTTVKGKEAFEQLQGSWLIEIAELSGMRQADVETVKHFITKRKDRYRVAYGRRNEEFPRQCIFLATTNDYTPLKDTTGGRRWWPVDVHEIAPTKNVSDLSHELVDQIWAEAVQIYKRGEKLYLSPAIEATAAQVQADHTETDERTGMVVDYLETELPDNWGDMNTYARRNWLASGSDELSARGSVRRDRVCAVEIGMECLGWEKHDVTPMSTRAVHNIMRTLPGWTLSKTKMRFKLYGMLKGYVRVPVKAVKEAINVFTDENELG